MLFHFPCKEQHSKDGKTFIQHVEEHVWHVVVRSVLVGIYFKREDARVDIRFRKKSKPQQLSLGFQI